MINLGKYGFIVARQIHTSSIEFDTYLSSKSLKKLRLQLLL